MNKVCKMIDYVAKYQQLMIKLYVVIKKVALRLRITPLKIIKFRQVQAENHLIV